MIVWYNIGAIFIFALVACGSPGPNNLMLTASGVNFGFWRTVPHMLGICFGFPLMFACIGLGLGAVFTSYPAIHQIMKYLSVGFLFWLGWKLTTARAIHATSSATRPLFFLEAAFFQWINPKAWIIIAAALGAFTIPDAVLWGQIILITVIFFFSAILTSGFWAYFGVMLSRLLKNPRHLQWLNLLLAVLMVGSVFPFLL